MPLSESSSISSDIANRYATAVFDLSKTENALEALEKDIVALRAALEQSADLHRLITSPVYSRSEMKTAILAVADALQLSTLVKNTLGLMASNRRLFVLPAMLFALREAMAKHKGEIAAQVTSAKALTKTQLDELAKTLKAKVGKTVNIEAVVNKDIIGGLIIKVGSKMIDTSVQSKLNTLQNTMKEVG